MKMKQTEMLKKTIKDNHKKFTDSKTCKEYEKAIRDFEMLVEEGLTTHRGYNLKSIDAGAYINKPS